MSISLQIGGVLAFLAVTLPAYWVLSRLLLRTAAPSVWLRRLLRTLVPLAGAAYLLFLAVSIDDLAREAVTTLLAGAVPTSVRSLVADVAAQFALFLSTAGVVLAAYAVVVPAIRHTRNIELSIATALRRMGRYMVVLTTVLATLFVPFHRIVTGEALGLAPLILIFLLVGLPAASPVLLRIVRPVRTPEPSERERLESQCDRAALDIEAIWILADADETLEIYVRGWPGRRQLYVSEFALTGFDGETLGALLAANAGSLEYHYRAIKFVPLYAFLVTGIAALAWGSPLSYAVVIVLACLLPLPVLWAARRAARHADDYAAARVGRDTVADALERMATEQNLDVPSGGVATIFRSRPPLQDRIDRLRNGTETGEERIARRP